MESVPAVPATVKLLSVEDILGSADRFYSTVYIKEWNGSVRLRTLDGEEAVEFSDLAKEKREESTALLIAMCAVDEDGKQLFTRAHVSALRKKCWPAIKKLQEAALTLNGMKNEEGKENEDSPKND